MVVLNNTEMYNYYGDLSLLSYIIRTVHFQFFSSAARRIEIDHHTYYLPYFNIEQQTPKITMF